MNKCRRPDLPETLVIVDESAVLTWEMVVEAAKKIEVGKYIALGDIYSHGYYTPGYTYKDYSAKYYNGSSGYYGAGGGYYSNSGGSYSNSGASGPYTGGYSGYYSIPYSHETISAKSIVSLKDIDTSKFSPYKNIGSYAYQDDYKNVPGH